MSAVNRISKITLSGLLAILAFSPAHSHAADPKKRNFDPCTNVIADKETGTFYSPKDKKSRFVCFKDPKTAKRSGFLSQKAIVESKLSGWYRLSLNTVKDTWSATPVEAGPVLFLQLKETDAGAFGDFCPSFGEFSGARFDTRVVLSSSQTVHENAAGSICDDGNVKIQRFVELSRAVDGGSAFIVSFKEVRSCVSEASGASTCIKEFRGQAFHETHQVWPEISDNLHQMTAACGQALTQCSTCHPGLDTGGIHP